MKKFSFPLGRVMQIREKQVALEESRLERLSADLRLLEARAVALDSEERESDLRITRATTFTAADLQAIDGFRRYARAQRAILTGQRAAAEKRIEEQRAKLVEARRNFELLSRLRAKRLEEWRRAMDRELEEAAAEAYLSRMHSSAAAEERA